MKKQSLFLAFIAGSAFLLGGCSNNTQTGALVGSLVGAGLGKSTANHHDSRAVIGAALGGLVGAAIGSEQDRVRQSYATTTNYQAAPPVYETQPETNQQLADAARSPTDAPPVQVVQRVVVPTTTYYYDDPYYYYSPIRPTIIIGGFYSSGRYYYKHPRRGHQPRYNRHHRRHAYRR